MTFTTSMQVRQSAMLETRLRSIQSMGCHLKGKFGWPRPLYSDLTGQKQFILLPITFRKPKIGCFHKLSLQTDFGIEYNNKIHSSDTNIHTL